MLYFWMSVHAGVKCVSGSCYDLPGTDIILISLNHLETLANYLAPRWEAKVRPKYGRLSYAERDQTELGYGAIKGLATSQSVLNYD